MKKEIPKHMKLEIQLLNELEEMARRYIMKEGMTVNSFVGVLASFSHALIRSAIRFGIKIQKEIEKKFGDTDYIG